jgi:hypothetical protein
MGFLKKKKLDLLLKKNSWVDVTNLTDNVLYTFLGNNKLLKTINGFGKNQVYEIMPNADSLTITIGELIIHFEILFRTFNFLIISPLGSDDKLILVNQNTFNQLLKGQTEKSTSLKTVCINEAIGMYSKALYE